jgi:transcriptional regulator with XRE-family HTH domain
MRQKSQTAIERGATIRRARTDKGLSQEQLAAHIGVSRAAVSQWEKGFVDDIRPEFAFRLSILLNIELDQLLPPLMISQIRRGQIDDEQLTPLPSELVSETAARLAVVWDTLDDDDPVKRLITEILDLKSRSNTHRNG